MLIQVRDISQFYIDTAVPIIFTVIRLNFTGIYIHYYTTHVSQTFPFN